MATGLISLEGAWESDPFRNKQLFCLQRLPDKLEFPANRVELGPVSHFQLQRRDEGWGESRMRFLLLELLLMAACCWLVLKPVMMMPPLMVGPGMLTKHSSVPLKSHVSMRLPLWPLLEAGQQDAAGISNDSGPVIVTSASKYLQAAETQRTHDAALILI